MVSLIGLKSTPDNQLLPKVADQIDMLELIFRGLPESDYAGALYAVDEWDRTLVQLVKPEQSILEGLLMLLPPELRLDLMTHRDVNDKSLIFSVANKPELLSSLLQLLPAEAQSFAVGLVQKESVPLIPERMESSPDQEIEEQEVAADVFLTNCIDDDAEWRGLESARSTLTDLSLFPSRKRTKNGSQSESLLSQEESIWGPS